MPSPESPSPGAVKPKRKSPSKRLDLLLTERGLAESRPRAQAMILAGQVLVNGRKVAKAGTPVSVDAAVEIVGEPLRYASRGGVKLEGALEDFVIRPAGMVCLDVGASTGGFTDCLLQHGATRVYAVDVNVSQLAWKLARDARVVKINRNARFLRQEDIPEPVELVTVDLAFISVAKVLPALVPLAASGTSFLILVKPQFELERKDVGRGGIVRDARLHRRAIERVTLAAEASGLAVEGVHPSRLPGSEGNREFFLHARLHGSGRGPDEAALPRGVSRRRGVE